MLDFINQKIKANSILICIFILLITTSMYAQDATNWEQMYRSLQERYIDLMEEHDRTLDDLETALNLLDDATNQLTNCDIALESRNPEISDLEYNKDTVTFDCCGTGHLIHVPNTLPRIIFSTGPYISYNVLGNIGFGSYGWMIHSKFKIYEWCYAFGDINLSGTMESAPRFSFGVRLGLSYFYSAN